MFVQVISGKVTDLDTFRRLSDQWDDELRPGAVGYLGATEGTTDDGRFFVAARFESAEAAAKNSARPEQGAWFAEGEKMRRDVSFHGCSPIETIFGGGKGRTGFFPVMRGHGNDRAKAREMFA